MSGVMPIVCSSPIAEDAEVGVVVGVAAELGRVGDEADLPQPGYQRRVELGFFGDLGQRVLVAGSGEEPFEARPVDIDDRPDRGEGEPLGPELPDTVEAVEVLLPVEPVATLLHRRLEQAFPGVVPDRVDGEAGPLGQLVDPAAEVVPHIWPVTPRCGCGGR